MSIEHTPRVPPEAVELAAEALWNAREYRDPSGDTPDDWYPPGDNPDQEPPREPALWAPLVAAGKYPASLEETRDDARAALAAALPAIHAERDRAWREALNGEGEIDQARAALAEVDRIAGNWRNVNEDAAAILHAVEPLRSLIENTESALDSLQVSGGAGLDAGDSGQRSTASAAETEAACSPAASVESSGKSQPEDQEGGAAEFTAEQEIADRQIVISFNGGPLNNGAGFARDLRPIQLAEGTYRFVEVGSDGDAVFEWGPTHYVDHSTQPDTSFGDREGEG